MDPTDHGDAIATRGDVVARVLPGQEALVEALAFLDEAAAVAQAPLVDETERVRLERAAAGEVAPAPHWHPLLARRAGVAVGYAGVLLPSDPGAAASGDVAVHRDRAPCEPALAALLAALHGLARRHGAGRLSVWLRRATADEVACAAAEGFAVERRLGILGLALGEQPEPVAPPPGVGIRAYRPGQDDDAVVAVLAAAYAGTADGGWTRERFAAKRDLPWFRPDDLLVADAGEGRLVGLHWLKRRQPGVGEVYNLAVRPGAQGGGLGAALLSAGLAHLGGAGTSEVLLWVDLDNDRAVRLYTAHGFRTRWEDVSLVRDLSGGEDGGAG
ncbi:MAG: GNAT family N-acetyltransferase [Actinobacteria bacterium]|nr:GNAT family N-acetyltransferase [Actinomycetota bacterium]